jgi:uncharacterized membrane protein
MTKRSKITIISIAVLVYSIILGSTGVFGNTVQDGLFYFFKNVLPIIGILVGYFLMVFIPIRVFSALERNSKAKEEFEKEQRLQEHAANSKEFQNNILEMLNKEDTAL